VPGIGKNKEEPPQQSTHAQQRLGTTGISPAFFSYQKTTGFSDSAPKPASSSSRLSLRGAHMELPAKAPEFKLLDRARQAAVTSW